MNSLYTITLMLLTAVIAQTLSLECAYNMGATGSFSYTMDITGDYAGTV